MVHLFRTCIWIYEQSKICYSRQCDWLMFAYKREKLAVLTNQLEILPCLTIMLCGVQKGLLRTLNKIRKIHHGCSRGRQSLQQN